MSTENCFKSDRDDASISANGFDSDARTPQINDRLSSKLLEIVLLKAIYLMSVGEGSGNEEQGAKVQDDGARKILSSVCCIWEKLVTRGKIEQTTAIHHPNGHLKSGSSAFTEGETVNSCKNDEHRDSEQISAAVPITHLFKRRWFFLLLFAAYSGTNAYQWIHLVIISDKIIIYYNSSLPNSDYGKQTAVDFLSMVFMIVYIPLIFPATWILDKKGLRLTAILGSVINAVSAWLKCPAVHPDRYGLLFFAQTISAVAQVFILGIPPRLAAVWFGRDEVSTATAIGVFGNQIGCALGFVIPPLIVSSNEPDEIGYKMSLMMYGGAAIMTVLSILVLIFFRSGPPVAPSQAQLKAASTWSNENYCGSLRRLLTNRGFLLLVITYGLNAASFYEISTLLNTIVLFYFPGDSTSAGNIGLTMILTGIAGSILSGIWLDKTKRYKMTTVAIYVLSFVGMVAFTFTLVLKQIWISYVCIGFLGFFMTGYLPVGFEFAAELTFPESEGTSSGLLNASAQLFGIILTLGVRAIMTAHAVYGVMAGNSTTAATLLIGSIVTILIKSDLRRQAAQQNELSDSVVNYENRGGSSTVEKETTEVDVIQSHTNNAFEAIVIVDTEPTSSSSTDEIAGQTTHCESAMKL